MNDSGVPLRTFTLRKKRSDDFLPSTRNVIMNWWVVETQVSLNKSDVTFKRLEAGIFDEKPTHFLMDTKVWNFITYFTHILKHTLWLVIYDGRSSINGNCWYLNIPKYFLLLLVDHCKILRSYLT
jgi:hypothetical protein